MKCPFCGAELAENSRFCLYCMKSLNEKEIVDAKKKKKWWLVLTAILLLVIIGLTVCFFVRKGEDKPVNNNSDIVESNEQTTGEQESTEKNETINQSDKNTESEQNSNKKDDVVSSSDSEKEDTTKNTNKTQETTSGKTTTTNKNTDNTTITTTTTTTTTTVPSNNSEQIESVVWYYRSAYSSEYDKRYNKVETANAITIIGFKNATSNGIYKIPETIGGKTVVAINMSNPQGYSFNDSAVKDSVRKVYLPPKLNKIGAGTFSECKNLTDVYVAGEYLYADPSVFPEKTERTGKLTIHTTDTSWCLYGSKYFYVYCSQYGANEYYASWKEWDCSVYN